MKEQAQEQEQRSEPKAEESTPTDGGTQAAQDQVEQDQDQRRPQTPPPDLAATKRERDEYLELAKRTRADFDNYRKRVAKETADALARGKAELARELIPVVDNLERALEAADADPGALRKGVALVYEELRAKLERAGVEAYDPVGEPFDPELHEALSTRVEEGTDSGRVLETVDKGYRLNGQVLRPARVVVSE